VIQEQKQSFRLFFFLNVRRRAPPFHEADAVRLESNLFFSSAVCGLRFSLLAPEVHQRRDFPPFLPVRRTPPLFFSTPSAFAPLPGFFFLLPPSIALPPLFFFLANDDLRDRRFRSFFPPPSDRCSLPVLFFFSWYAQKGHLQTQPFLPDCSPSFPFFDRRQRTRDSGYQIEIAGTPPPLLPPSPERARLSPPSPPFLRDRATKLQRLSRVTLIPSSFPPVTDA